MAAKGFHVRSVGGEGAGLKTGDAEKAPLDVDKFLGERGLDSVEWVKGLEHGSREGLVVSGVFAGEEDGFGRESVLESVERRDGLARVRTRTTAIILCVGQIGLILCFGRHDGFFCPAENGKAIDHPMRMTDGPGRYIPMIDIKQKTD